MIYQKKILNIFFQIKNKLECDQILCIKKGKGMKIVFIGAQGTGKSTLIEKIQKEFLPNYIISPSIGRELKQMKFNINMDGDDETEKMAMLLHKKRFEEQGGNVLYPRSFIDNLVYTEQVYIEKKVTQDTFKYCYNQAKEYMPKYDLFFYIPIEFDIEDDGTRSTDKDFQKRTDKLLQQYIVKFELPVNTLIGSVENRFETFKKFYNLFIGVYKQ